MALKFRDPVAVKHPNHKGYQIVSRNAAGVMAGSGWAEDKSPEAKAAVVKATRPQQDEVTTPAAHGEPSKGTPQ
jgi:hypothetical protein